MSLVQTPDESPKAVELETCATSSRLLETRKIGMIGPNVSSTTSSLLGLTLSNTTGGRRAPSLLG